MFPFGLPFHYQKQFHHHRYSHYQQLSLKFIYRKIVIIIFIARSVCCQFMQSLTLFLELIKVNQSGNEMLKPSEGSTFSLYFDALTNFQPKVFWFKDSILLKDSSSINYTVNILSNQSSHVLYRSTLLKVAASRNDSGFYQGFIQLVKRRILIRNFTLLVRCK